MAKRKQQSIPDEQLDALEAHLAGTLRPVSPPNEFVQHLRERIRMPKRESIYVRLRDWNRLFLVFGSVMSSLLLIITFARALYYLVGRKNMA